MNAKLERPDILDHAIRISLKDGKQAEAIDWLAYAQALEKYCDKLESTIQKTDSSQIFFAPPTNEESQEGVR